MAYNYLLSGVGSWAEVLCHATRQVKCLPALQVSPTTLFFVEGCGQLSYGMCWGDGFVTDPGEPFHDLTLTGRRSIHRSHNIEDDCVQELAGSSPEASEGYALPMTITTARWEDVCLCCAVSLLRPTGRIRVVFKGGPGTQALFTGLGDLTALLAAQASSHPSA